MSKKKCPTCQKPIPGNANFCLDHTSPHSRAKRIRTAKKRVNAAAETLSADAAKPGTEDASADAWLASAAEVLAVGLSVRDDPVEAARVVGLEIRGAKLKAAHAEALANHSGLRDRKPGAVGAIIGQGLILAAIALRSKMHTLPPGQIAPAVKALAQAMELVQGTTQPTFTNFTINVRSGKSSDENETKVSSAIGGATATSTGKAN